MDTKHYPRLNKLLNQFCQLCYEEGLNPCVFCPLEHRKKQDSGALSLYNPNIPNTQQVGDEI